MEFTSGTPGNRDCVMGSGVSACSNMVHRPCFMYPIPILSPSLFIPSLYVTIHAKKRHKLADFTGFRVVYPFAMLVKTLVLIAGPIPEI